MQSRTLILALTIMLISFRGLTASGGNFIFLADSVSGQIGTQVTVGVRCLEFQDIISIQGSLHYDTSKVTWLGIQQYGLPSMGAGNFGVNNAANGWVTFSWNESNLMPISVPDSTLMFALVFQLHGGAGSQTPVEFSNSPTLLEVVDENFTPIGHLERNGNIDILPLPTCPAPDSLQALSIGTTQTTLSWMSVNAGVSYLLEWGPQGFIPGNGMGDTSGTSALGQNTVLVNGLSAGTGYDFYVQEDCGALMSLNVGPAQWITEHILPPNPAILFGDSVAGPGGQLVTVNVRAVDLEGLISAQGTIAWDTSVAHYDGMATFGLPSMSAANFGNTQAANGILTFSWNDPTLTGVTVGDSASLFGIQFRLTFNSGTATPLQFVNSPTPIEFSDNNFSIIPMTLVFGELRIFGTSDAGEAQASRYQVYPNPLAHGATGFAIKGLNDGAEINLWNSLGEKQEVRCKNDYCLVTLSLSSGLWILEVKDLEGNWRQKLLVR